MELEVDFLTGVANLEATSLVDVFALLSGEMMGPFYNKIFASI
jgi:hypothetical protein